MSKFWETVILERVIYNIFLRKLEALNSYSRKVSVIKSCLLFPLLQSFFYLKKKENLYFKYALMSSIDFWRLRISNFRTNRKPDIFLFIFIDRSTYLQPEILIRKLSKNLFVKTCKTDPTVIVTYTHLEIN